MLTGLSIGYEDSHEYALGNTSWFSFNARDGQGLPELYRTDYPDNNVTDHAIDTNTSVVSALASHRSPSPQPLLQPLL